MRVKAKRRETPALPPEFLYAERDASGTWLVVRDGETRGTRLSELHFLALWEPYPPFAPFVEPPGAPSVVRELVREKADRGLVWLINWANRMRRTTAPAPETYVPRPGVEERVLVDIPMKAPAVAGEVIE
jgi:hypothetical protein